MHGAETSALPPTFLKGAQSVRTSTEIGSVSQYTCRRASRTTYDNFYGWQLCSTPNLPSNQPFNKSFQHKFGIVHINSVSLCRDFYKLQINSA